MLIFFLILIKSISIIINQTCGMKNPQNFEDCYQHSSLRSICCFTKIETKINMEDNNTKSDTLCIFVPRSQIFITPHIKSLDIGANDGNIDIKLECGFDPNKLTLGEPYSYCGESPKTPFDCINNSTSNASCCYIQNPNGETFCVLNNGIYNSNRTLFGVKVICASKFNSIKLYFLISLLFFSFFSL